MLSLGNKGLGRARSCQPTAKQCRISRCHSAVLCFNTKIRGDCNFSTKTLHWRLKNESWPSFSILFSLFCWHNRAELKKKKKIEKSPELFRPLNQLNSYVERTRNLTARNSSLSSPFLWALCSLLPALSSSQSPRSALHLRLYIQFHQQTSKVSKKLRDERITGSAAQRLALKFF